MDAQSELTIRKIAGLADTGLAPKEIAAQLKITLHQVKKLQATDEYRGIMVAVGDKYLAEAKQKWSQGCARLLDKCLTVLKSQLDNDSLEAVKIAMRTLGLEREELKSADTTIQIVLPATETLTVDQTDYLVRDTTNEPPE